MTESHDPKPRIPVRQSLRGSPEFNGIAPEGMQLPNPALQDKPDPDASTEADSRRRLRLDHTNQFPSHLLLAHPIMETGLGTPPSQRTPSHSGYGQPGEIVRRGFLILGITPIPPAPDVDHLSKVS